MAERGEPNGSNLVSMAEWKERALSRIQHTQPQPETATIHKEELVFIMQEYITHLESLLSDMQESLARIKSSQKEQEQNAGYKITWNPEVLAWNEKQEFQIRTLEEHISKGKFLLTRKDLEGSELIDFLRIELDSLQVQGNQI